MSLEYETVSARYNKCVTPSEGCWEETDEGSMGSSPEWVSIEVTDKLLRALLIQTLYSLRRSGC